MTDCLAVCSHLITGQSLLSGWQSQYEQSVLLSLTLLSSCQPVNTTMLLRTVLLLLLCVSTGICATLGHYQARAEEEEEGAPAVTDAADLDAAVEGVAPADVEVEPADDSLFNDNLGAEILAADDPAADKPEVDAPEADGATAKEPETKSDSPAVDTPAVEAFISEAVTETQPSDEDAATQEKPESDEAVTQEKPAEEDIAPEKTLDEADTQEKPAQEKEEEDNEIKPVPTEQALNAPLAQEESSSWSFNSIRSSFQTVNGYFDSLVELVGGQDGVCQYRCRYGEIPQSRPGYQLPEPNGCSSSLVGFQLDMGIPAMTKCCDQLDMCYDTCGAGKYDCDSKFRSCLHDICSDVNKSLGFVSKVEACESMADTLFNTVWTLGCRPYMNSQRAACVCAGEERDEL
ncbi:group XIIB secretory phospholipase A2-like protein isoform X2 [Labrus mixtus]|uniref:group XIIB secretory phospholipase A2-like protein isoform X2 n=1 Tax=Labrus mixtus TaxID=508554 RepID=UPI0029C0697B|nr:group XIIB secretory phospholipase A2-like protein isoform X2 [Labrus mixtus]